MLLARIRLGIGVALAAAGAFASVAAGQTGDRAVDRARGTGTVHYYGGHVVTNVKVYLVFWGPGGPSLTATLPQFLADVTASPYLDWLAEYDTRGLSGFTDGLAGSNQPIARGSFSGSFTIVPSVTATTVDNTQIQAELVSQLAAHVLPTPDLDFAGNVDAVYLVVFPAGITVTQGGNTSCVDFCAYHHTVTYNGLHVPHIVLPFLGTGSPCAGVCGSGTDLENTTVALSKQLVDAITDPELGTFLDAGLTTAGRPLGWIDPTPGAGEVGEICNGQWAMVGTWTVQKNWSQSLQSCIATNPALKPLCGPSAPPPPDCRPCSAADEGRLCSGTTPFCEVEAANPKAGQCVACTKDSHCPADERCKKSFGATDDTCGCTASSCSGIKYLCAGSGPNNGHCVQCLAAAGATCFAPKVCDEVHGICVNTCASTADCASDQCFSSSCDLAAGLCTWEQAPDGMTCDRHNPCTTSDYCSGGLCRLGPPPAVSPCPQDPRFPCVFNWCDSVAGHCQTDAPPDGYPCPGGNCHGGACVAADAGVEPDAGPPSDAGPRPDGSSAPAPARKKGCGCGGGAAAGLPPLLLVALRRAQRRSG